MTPPDVERALREREALADDFEAARASGLNIAEAAKAFKVRTEDLDWALWATDPKNHGDGEAFNHAYAQQRLAEAVPAWRQARDGLRYALEQNADVFLRAHRRLPDDGKD